MLPAGIKWVSARIVGWIQEEWAQVTEIEVNQGTYNNLYNYKAHIGFAGGAGCLCGTEPLDHVPITQHQNSGWYAHSPAPEQYS